MDYGGMNQEGLKKNRVGRGFCVGGNETGEVQEFCSCGLKITKKRPNKDFAECLRRKDGQGAIGGERRGGERLTSRKDGQNKEIKGTRKDRRGREKTQR